MATTDTREPTPHEKMQEKLRRLRALQRQWTVAREAFERDKELLLKSGATAEAYDARAYIRIPSEKRFTELCTALENARQDIAYMFTRDEQLFNVMWSVFGLARED